MHTQDSQAITHWLGEQQEAMVRLLADLVNIDSGSYDKAGVDAVGARLIQFFSEHGIEVSVTPHAEFGDILRAETGDVHRGEQRHNILLMGHRDTVFPKGEASRRPFSVKDGRAYGPGVADMKAGLVMNAFVLAAFKRFAPQVPLVALMTGDEEIGSNTSRDFIAQEAKSAIAVFNAEPGRASGNIVTSRKGSLSYRFDITGKEAHSGVNFTEGVNAIAELGHKIVALHDLTRVEDGITVNVGLVSGGQSVNTTAPHASAGFEVRFVTNEQRDATSKAIEAIMATSRVPGTTTKLVCKSNFLALVPTAESEKLAAYYLQSARDLGTTLEGEFTGGCADSGFTASAGAPTICGVGPVGGKAHTAAEYIELHTLHQRAHILAETIRKVFADAW
jgi:glutamate carboxypeptidase